MQDMNVELQHFTIWLLEAENMLADPLAHSALNNTAQNAQLSA